MRTIKLTGHELDILEDVLDMFDRNKLGTEQLKAFDSLVEKTLVLSDERGLAMWHGDETEDTRLPHISRRK